MSDKLIAAIIAATLNSSGGATLPADTQQYLDQQRELYIEQKAEQEAYNLEQIAIEEAEAAAEAERIAAEQAEAERLAYEAWLKENPEFPKYDLTVEELTGIARLCQQEQESLEGSAAEASLIANRYELYGGNYSSIYSYARNSGWWANAPYIMSSIWLRPEIYDIVKTVLMEGKRTLPKYVDEHDCISDIRSISTGNKWNASDYHQFETMVYNCYGASYGYYGRPGTTDVFGWSNNQYRAELGEDHYEFEKILTK